MSNGQIELLPHGKRRFPRHPVVPIDIGDSRRRTPKGPLRRGRGEPRQREGANGAHQRKTAAKPRDASSTQTLPEPDHVAEAEELRLKLRGDELLRNSSRLNPQRTMWDTIVSGAGAVVAVALIALYVGFALIAAGLVLGFLSLRGFRHARRGRAASPAVALA